MYFYSNPNRASEPHALPNAEVFFINDRAAKLARDRVEFADTELTEPGWYYWFCFPGCLPDGSANGPYESEREAIDACQNDDSDSVE